MKKVFTFKWYTKYLILTVILLGFFTLYFVTQNVSFYEFFERWDLLFVCLIIISVFFIYPIYTFLHLKIFERKSQHWIMNYPYLRKQIKISEEEIFEISIIDNARAKYLTYNLVTIKFKTGKKAQISSLEIIDYQNFILLLKKDFKSKINHQDFLKGKVE